MLENLLQRASMARVLVLFCSYPSQYKLYLKCECDGAGRAEDASIQDEPGTVLVASIFDEN